MKLEHVMPFKELREWCIMHDAPVYPRRRISRNKTFFVRRQGFTVQDVENFFARLTKDERTMNET